MSDPLGFFLLLAVGTFAMVLGIVGIRRGKAVGVFDWRRDEKPGLFWYGVIFQMSIGAVCLVLAIVKIFQ